MITAKERVMNAIEGKEVDRVPVVCPGGMMNMVVEDIMDIKNISWPSAHNSSLEMAELTYGLYENKCFDNVGVPFCMTVEAEAMGATIFMGSKITEPRVCEYPIELVNEYEKLKDIDVTSGRVKIVTEAIKILKEKDSNVPIIGNVVGPISLASSLIEPVIFYKDMRRNKDGIHKYMDFITNNLIVYTKALIDAGADIIAISEPSGTGEILGPKMFEEFATPYINRLIDAIKGYSDKKVILHICGRLKSVYSELNLLHNDVISFETLTSVKDIMENVKDKCFMGNISTLTLEQGTEETVKNLTEHCIKNGVKIIAPACGLGTKSPIGNLKAMIKTSENY